MIDLINEFMGKDYICFSLGSICSPPIITCKHMLNDNSIYCVKFDKIHKICNIENQKITL